jgi:hypothetical protein
VLRGLGSGSRTHCHGVSTESGRTEIPPYKPFKAVARVQIPLGPLRENSCQSRRRPVPTVSGQALAFMFAMVGVVAKRYPQAPARKLANGYLILFGASALIWSAAHLIANWSTLDQDRIVREFLLPIRLTPVALLFV